MQKEYDFQTQKRHSRLHEAIQEGWVDADHPEAQHPEYVAFEQRERRLEPQRVKDRTRAAAKRTRAFARRRGSCDVGAARGARTFFEATVPADKANAIVALHSSRRTAAPREAEVFVVPNFADAGLLTQWSLMLLGGILCTATYLQSQGNQSGKMVVLAAIRTPRKVWLSADFCDTRPELAAAVRHAVAQPRSRWRLIGGAVDDWHRLMTHAKGAMSCVALVSDLEKTIDIFNVKSAMTSQMFLETFTTIDEAKTVVGVCAS